MPPSPFERARAVERNLAGFEEGALRTVAAARALTAGPPEEAAQLLADALALARAGERQLAAALGEALLAAPREDLPYPRIADIYAVAAELGDEAVCSLFVAPEPQRRWEEPRDRADPRLAQLTLGHKKSLARSHRDPDLLARLAAEGEPVVVRELLRNPRMTEELVVRIAARRPCRPGTLRCLHEDGRWRRSPAIARAIAFNPYAEPTLVTKLLPRLNADDLAEVAADPGLHALVRALARRLAGKAAVGSSGTSSGDGG
jgi:hypothetical protein